ncbi:MAG: pyruvate kinase [Synergistota bacterium]|nr:pyruvate kinase [Synergistota bacterium]
MKRAKIVCTLGPSCSDYGVMRSMAIRGMDVARFNFSHGDHSTHGANLDSVRRLEKDLGRPLATMLDTKGPEIRTGKIRGGSRVSLEFRDRVLLVPGVGEGTSDRIYVDYDSLARELNPEDMIFIDDGSISLKVEKQCAEGVWTEVVTGGELGERKGVSIPGGALSLPILTEKDKDDVRWAIERQMDYIALSFVRSRDDVMSARRVIEEMEGSLRVVAKIETRQAVDNLEEIVEVVDAVMVARGDLGVEIPLEDVPVVQKRIISLCRSLGKPVIVATQMLDSMIRNPRATRAEASDVANAVLDGADALMLSGETASGAWPGESVSTMARIIERTEEVFPLPSARMHPYSNTERVEDAVSNAAGSIADRMKARAVLSLTQSGSTAQMVSKYRPVAPIIGATPSERTLKMLTLVWGVIPLLCSREKDLESALSEAMERALEKGFLEEGDLVVATAGVPVGMKGTTNTIEVLTVGKVLVTGLSLLNRDASGRVVRALTAREAVENTRHGDVLVVRQTDRDYIPAMRKAAAVVAEEGGLTCHAAIVSLEFRIPCIVNAKGALAALEPDVVVTVDGSRGVVYRGKVRLHSGS